MATAPTSVWQLWTEAWDPAKHPRGPDGRFIKVGDAAKTLTKAAKAATKTTATAAKKTAAAAGKTAPAVKKATKKAANPVGTGTEIRHVSAEVRKLVFASYKAQPKGQLLSSPAQQSYDNLLAVAHVYGGKVDGGLNVGQTAKIIDEQLTQHQGLTNKHFLEKKTKDWLATAEGAAYAKANTKPQKSIVDSLTGKAPHASGVKLKPGEKVQKLAGPGRFDKTLTEADFTSHTDSEMQKLQDTYLQQAGKTWSSEQISAITNYSGGGYSGMNDYLRGTTASASPLVQGQITSLQSAMLPVQEHAKVLRGTGWAQFPVGFRSPELVKKLVGKTIVDPGFFSTSVAGSPGHFTGQAVRLEVEVPKGTHAVFVKKYSLHSHENELLLAAGTKFRVVSVKAAGTKTVVRLRVVTAK